MLTLQRSTASPLWTGGRSKCCGEQDLAYFLTQSLHVEERRKHERGVRLARALLDRSLSAVADLDAFELLPG